MKIKPKKFELNIPVVLFMDDTNSILNFVASINTILHGKQKLKYQILGDLNDKNCVLFYVDRDADFFSLKENFDELINKEQLSKST